MRGMCQPVSNSLAELASRGGYMTPACGLALKNLYNSDTQIYATLNNYTVTFSNNEITKTTSVSTSAPSQGGSLRGTINAYPTQTPTYSIDHNLVKLSLSGSTVTTSRETGASETGKFQFTTLAT